MAALAEPPTADQNPGEFDTSMFPYRFEVVAVTDMIVDHTYQREPTSFVNKIVENFDPALVGTLVLSERPPKRDKIKFAVVDGQTRMLATTKLKIPALPAIVYVGMTVAHEAALFAKLQKERKGIMSWHRFRAAMVAGEEEPNAIAAIVRECGYEIPGTSKGERNKAREIVGTAGLEKVYRRSPQILERTLTILDEAWGDKHMPAAEHIRGLGVFLATNTPKPGINDEKLAKKLKAVSPTDLKIAANHLRQGTIGGGTTEKYMSQAIAGLYGIS